METHVKNDGRAKEPDKLVKFDEVRDSELVEITKRRQAVGLLGDSKDPILGPTDPRCQEVKQELVGLALSGGGVRSASFNLGLLQALVGTPLFKQIDYLSTVSGGGYIGAHLSTLVMQKKQSPSHEKFPLRVQKDGSQPKDVRRLLRGGAYLKNYFRFFNRYLFGLILLNTALLSGLLFLTAFCAWCWRLLDSPPIHTWLVWASRHIVLDWNRPFLPCIILLVAWFITWGLSSVRRGTTPEGKTPLLLLGLSGGAFLIGCAVWLATPNIYFESPFSQNAADQATFWVRHQLVITPLIALLGLCLLPLLAPRKLLRSGVTPTGLFERTIFRVVSVALLCGVPMALILFFAQNNLSGHATRKDRALVPSDIRDWEGIPSHPTS